VQRRVVGGDGLDEGDVGVGREELGIGRVDDQHPHVGVRLQRPADGVELDDELQVEQVDGGWSRVTRVIPPSSATRMQWKSSYARGGL
jgi:hypothetical protein